MFRIWMRTRAPLLLLLHEGCWRRRESLDHMAVGIAAVFAQTFAISPLNKARCLFQTTHDTFIWFLKYVSFTFFLQIVAYLNFTFLCYYFIYVNFFW
jgi:hypothetical protein